MRFEFTIMNPLAQSILKTLVFFDAQDLPLTLFELRTYLQPFEVSAKDISLLEILDTLSTELVSQIGSAEGFYFLRGRQQLVKFRQERYPISLRRYRKAKKYLSFLKFFPYIRAVALSGSLALLNSGEKSDIDLLVLTKKNRIWLVRMLMSFYFQVLGQRRYGLKISNRFCLNHYLREGLLITQDQNLYTAVEYASLLPVLGEEELSNFWLRNSWLSQFLQSPGPQAVNQFFRFTSSRFSQIQEFLLDYTLAPILNWFAGIYQKRRIKMQEHILVSDDELSFHPGSRGQKVLAFYHLTLKNQGL